MKKMSEWKKFMEHVHVLKTCLEALPYGVIVFARIRVELSIPLLPSPLLPEPFSLNRPVTAFHRRIFVCSLCFSFFFFRYHAAIMAVAV